jgi:hypothetical protein
MRKYSTSDPKNKIIHECALHTSELFLLFYICITSWLHLLKSVFLGGVLPIFFLKSQRGIEQNNDAYSCLKKKNVWQDFWLDGAS